MFDWLAQSPADQQLLDWLTRGGGLGVLALAVVAFLRGWIVPGKAYDQVQVEKERALELIFKQAELTQRALEVAEIRKP